MATALRVEWVRYGRPAAHALRAAISEAKGGDPLVPATVVVPSNHVGVAARRLLASGAVGPVCPQGAGLAAVSFFTTYRLAELVAAPALAAAGRRPVSTPVVAAAVRAALADHPGVFASVAGHPATEAALVDAYRELRDHSPTALDRLAASGARAADVVAVHLAARRRLRSSWYDEQDLLAAAAEALRAPGAGRRPGPPPAADLGTVVVHLPQRLSLHEALMLVAASEHGDVAVLAGTTGDERADAEVIESLSRLGTSTPPPPPGAASAMAAVVARERTRVVTTSDADDEVRCAVRAILDAVRSGMPLDRVAVLHAASEPYARLVHEQLAAAGIPANGRAVVPLSARVAGRALLDLLSLAHSGFRRQDVMAWLMAAPVLHQGRWAPAVAWERVSRRAGVVAGRSDWDERLSKLSDDLEAQAERADQDPDAPPWSADRHRDDARMARSLRQFAVGLFDDLINVASAPRRWRDHAVWAHGLLAGLLGGADRRAEWPPPEQKAAERVERALDRLAALDPVEGRVTLELFARTLRLELEADIGRTGRFGDGVLVGSVGMGLGLDLDLVIVLGLVEGSFPGPVRADALLADHEREAAGELALHRHRIEREHRQLLAVLAGSRRHLLGVPRGDLRRSSERVPSRWVVEAASSLFGSQLWSDDVVAASAQGIDHVPSFDAGLRRLSWPATEQEHRLQSLLAGAAVDDPVLRAGREVMAARRSDRFTRFDGNLSGLAVPSPADEVTSPTRLERWATCPLAYLFENLLGLRAVENPEEQLVISALDRGSLVHEALERFVLGVLERGDGPGPGEPWSKADRAHLASIGARTCDEYEARGLTGRAVFWRRDRAQILADLERFLDADDAHRRLHSARPVAAELSFGFAGGLGPVALRLPEGRLVRFRGRADRLDVAGDGTLHVVDYKTGRHLGFEKLCEADPDLRGTKLQLAVYGLAARLRAGHCDAPVHAEYWFVSTRGNFRRIGYTVTPAVLDHVGATVGTMVRGIEAGLFPPNPTATSTSRWVECHPCDPDGLGVTELRRQWEHKRHDPAVAVFAGLAHPPAATVEPEVEEVRGA